MARPREFDADEALEKAMELFWDVGYDEASLSELLDAMAITKGSFYKAFQDKQSVYLAALDRYNDQVVSNTVAFLGDPSEGAGRDRILALFGRIADLAQKDGDRLGCFLCNALVDKAGGAEAEARLQAMTRRLENGFYRALQDDGLEGAEARGTARGVLTAYFGLRVLGRAGLSADMAADCIRQVERLLGRVH
ncbi:HTH-type transcriptional repressor ComR [Labrenzia sp. THAF191b]|uniref:TetR/AcrR family transcriptional regulator n=1 Tax=unclassified Labrenzia TaxID=2648686 RepID=UPI001267931F|nr:MULTISPECIES: TetR/AcrR family transcriptional regulator [unclassified Labrenzia]QFS99276.1 HTH-type transcriptional repressor ComR [Labrenzia sp. THAF191b]QFT05590.1 HTH-type transcriptional repressor ComR [Labrenzia sp. THAF191a]QFT17134.1 HTH-type transcriptional repressor ComR [Labrenzia sp. THAF187b]